ncbi:MAG: Alpha-amylase family protein, partial [Labilithrix sp.]|nr:Alpha-amylase family protein [Labilithrix sp.]
MHARKSARDQYFPSPFDDVFFAPRGDIAFKGTGDARRFADKINARDGRHGEHALRPAELAAMALVHEILHAVLGVYRKQHPASFAALQARLGERLGGAARSTRLDFLRHFPTPGIYRRQVANEGDETPETYLATGGQSAEDEITEEVILLWLTNQNPAYEPVRPLITDEDMGPEYKAFVGEAESYFREDRGFGPNGEKLLDLLLAPSRAAPHSILDQLKFIEGTWAEALNLGELGLTRRVLWARDFLSEEGKYFTRGGPGPGAPKAEAMRFERTPEEEPKRFSADLAWMPRVVLVAKTVFVWLDQLSKKYGRTIERLDEIPDEELDLLASRGFTGLWLIGLFERSIASRKIKQMRGDAEAVASAYSLMRYDIAAELGGYPAYQSLRERAWQRGIRLAADMVPNHVGIDADWVIQHPEWFLQTPQPPFPGYKFTGPDLSEDPRVGVYIEDGYWNKTDAAVVFRRHDRQTNEDRFLYHGNDGTSMPWNDTAQLDYTRAEVRHAVIETILHVARMFPIIRFDAAMTLAKRHFSRLWFPLPGSGGAIPSRSDYAMTQEEFEHVFPVEFWREVVDTVAARAPDTLLLAEAFWMMEGYFVRSLGMHRVYNSAFMNMMKREENAKYRETIKNVLDFEPEILERFVNFMNNPDEETAVEQFGGDDKYFGVCVVMCTMPGLPMFGHGQVEGLHEKYGMEYRRPKLDEHPSQSLVERHEREVFPVIKKRYLFSNVAEFSLFDFVTEEGHVDEDVYAYANGVGEERALVLYNNKFKDTRGRILRSMPTRRADGHATARTAAEAMGVAGAGGEWLVFRDIAKGLDYLRPLGEIEGGFSWELGAFKYHVLTEFRTVTASAEMPYHELAAEIGRRGVPSLARAMVMLRYRPVHAPLRDAASTAHLAYLAGGWDPKTKAPTKAALTALEQRLGYLGDGLAYMRPDVTLDREEPLAVLRKRYAKILSLANAEATDRAAIHERGAAGGIAKAAGASEASDGTGKPSVAPAKPTGVVAKLASVVAKLTGSAPKTDAPKADAAIAADAEPPASEAEAAKPSSAPPSLPAVDTALLVAWAEVEAVLDLLAQVEPNKKRADLVTDWELALPLGESLGRDGDDTDAAAHRRAALVLVAATLPAGPLRESMAAALEDDLGRALLGVHHAGGETWLHKESFEELARLLAHREAVEGIASLAMAEREVLDVTGVAATSGYKAGVIADALGATRSAARPASGGAGAAETAGAGT